MLITFGTNVFHKPFTTAFGYVVVPFEKGISNLGGWLSRRSDELVQIRKLMDENEMLKLIDDLINQYYEISEDYDLNNIINDFVTSEKEKLIDMIKNNPLSVDETLSLVYDILTFVQNANLEVVDERIIATAPNKESKLELLRENSNISLVASNISYEDYIGNGKISLSNNKQSGGTLSATNITMGGQIWSDSPLFETGSESTSDDIEDRKNDDRNMTDY